MSLCQNRLQEERCAIIHSLLFHIKVANLSYSKQWRRDHPFGRGDSRCRSLCISACRSASPRGPGHGGHGQPAERDERLLRSRATAEVPPEPARRRTLAAVLGRATTAHDRGEGHARVPGRLPQGQARRAGGAFLAGQRPRYGLAARRTLATSLRRPTSAAAPSVGSHADPKRSSRHGPLACTCTSALSRAGTSARATPPSWASTSTCT